MQLVELQRNVHQPKGDQVAVVAVSYDTVDLLAGFAEEHGIGYPLLADVGSTVITDLGLLNTQIAEERAFWGKPVEDRHLGLPYPGTFLLDSEGVVIEKIFERSHRLRPGGRVLLDRFGLDELPGERVVTAEGPALSVAAWVDEPEYFPNQLNRLKLRLAVDEGFHVYVRPNPTDFTNLAVEVQGSSGVFVHDPTPVEGHPFRVEGFSEEFTVAEGEFEVAVPFYVLEDTGSVKVLASIRYQACSGTTCLPPDSLELVVDLEEVRA